MPGAQTSCLLLVRPHLHHLLTPAWQRSPCCFKARSLGRCLPLKKVPFARGERTAGPLQDKLTFQAQFPSSLHWSWAATFLFAPQCILLSANTPSPHATPNILKNLNSELLWVPSLALRCIIFMKLFLVVKMNCDKTRRFAECFHEVSFETVATLTFICLTRKIAQ